MKNDEALQETIEQLIELKEDIATLIWLLSDRSVDSYKGKTFKYVTRTYMSLGKEFSECMDDFLQKCGDERY